MRAERSQVRAGRPAHADARAGRLHEFVQNALKSVALAPIMSVWQRHKLDVLMPPRRERW